MNKDAGKVFAKMVEAVPERELPAEAVRAIVRDAAASRKPCRKPGRTVRYRERSALPLAVAALALFMLVPALGGGGPSLAERAEAAYENGLFARYGSVILEAMMQGTAPKTGSL